MLVVASIVIAGGLLLRGPGVDQASLPDRLRAIVESNQPALPPDAPDAYAILLDLGRQTDAIDARHGYSGFPDRPVFDALYAPDPSYSAEDISRARATLDSYVSEGVFDQLAAMSAAPRAVRPLPPGDLVDFAMTGSGSHARNLTRALAARMHDQLAGGDQAGAVRSFESLLALTRVLEAQSTYIDLLVGRAIAALAEYRLRPAIHEGSLTDETLASIAEAITRQTGNRPPASRFLEMERLFALEAVREFTPILRSMEAGRINDFFDAATELATAPRPERLTDPKLVRLTKYIETNDRSGPSAHASTVQLIWTYDVGTTDTNGTLIMIALERHRLATGAYPDSLAALPEAASLAAASPWPLVYRRTEDGYTLYAAGEDGTDDGGTPHPEVPVQALMPENPGTDYVIH